MTRKRTVAVLLYDRVNAIDVTGPLEAFATANSKSERDVYRIVSWAIADPVVRTESGLRLMADELVPKRPRGDVLILPGGAGVREERTLQALAGWLREHGRRFERVASVCTGAYALAESGLIDGRSVTTHWAFAADLRKRYPRVRVRPDALFLSDGRYYSSGGVTSGIDLALDLIERDLGVSMAMNVARELVVFLRRTGSQTQFSLPLRMQAQAAGRLGDVCRWAASHLDEDLSVESLATRAGLSARQFSRRFSAAFGAPPAAYIKRLRLDAGRTLLGEGIGIAQVAHATGFGSSDGFRRAFESRFGVSPGEYQKRFRQSGERR